MLRNKSAHTLQDRELSWLYFNRRVLELASLENTPLFERLRFLGIFCSNLDEFFMKRIGGLKRQIKAGINSVNIFGKTPEEEIVFIRQALEPDLKHMHSLFREELYPALCKHGFQFKSYADLNNTDKSFADNYFHKNIFPLLTPLSVDAGHPFPVISNLSTNIACALKEPGHDDLQFARVKINHLKDQWILCSNRDGEHVYTSIKSLLIQHLPELFPGLHIQASCIFRVTRNAGLEVASDDDADDLLELVAEELRQRKFSEVVRIEFGNSPDAWLRSFICDNLEVREYDIFESPSNILSYTSFVNVLERAPRALLYKPFKPQAPEELIDEPDIFSLLSNQDLIVYHPYHSFTYSVEQFLHAASHDPQVKSIKMTLYRVGDANKLIPLLINAAESGKSVVCLIEVKARFDEERNIEWANTLEDAGIHVVYGLPGLKTHAKSMVVIRQEKKGLKAYAHIGTGNYNPTTAKLYTDLGLFTANTTITKDLLDFFNYLTGRSLKHDYKQLLVAPTKLEQDIIYNIEKEINFAQHGQDAHIIAALNNLEDEHIISALYDAANAGVKIDLIVRGICCLVPDNINITVRSILGRFLEHTRLFYFNNGANNPVDGSFFISSADWMYRNMHRRVELACPILSKPARLVCLDILTSYLRADIVYWHMLKDGTYKLIMSDESKELHEYFIEKYCKGAY